MAFRFFSRVPVAHGSRDAINRDTGIVIPGGDDEGIRELFNRKGCHHVPVTLFQQ